MFTPVGWIELAVLLFGRRTVSNQGRSNCNLERGRLGRFICPRLKVGRYGGRFRLPFVQKPSEDAMCIRAFRRGDFRRYR